MLDVLDTTVSFKQRPQTYIPLRDQMKQYEIAGSIEKSDLSQFYQPSSDKSADLMDKS